MSVRRLALFSFVCCLFLAPRAEANGINPTRTYDREMAIYFGTWDVFELGNPVAIDSFTFVELTDHIADDLRVAIVNDGSVDPRVKAALLPWVDPIPTGLDWTIGAFENLPAGATFAASIAGLGGAITTDSGLSLAAFRTYLFGTFQTVETAPVFVGDTDSPVIFGADGELITIDELFNAEVSFFERNGSVTVDPAVPEPATLTLLGLASLGAIARRRRSSSVVHTARS